MLKLDSPLLRIAAVTAFVGGLACAVPSYAQSSDMSAPPASDESQSSDQDNTAAQTAPAATHGEKKVEQRIKTLHDKLKITSSEESDWGTVAQTMRDNEAQIGQLIEARHRNAGGMTAVDDLQSYQKITQAHADGLQKMVSSFRTLYNDMTPAQKRNADDVFGRYEGQRHKAHGKKHAM